MRKTRNSFFTEANMNYQGFNNIPMMPNQNIPYQASTNFNSFYSGPGVKDYPTSTDSNMESRLAKIERQINRLDHRITKLENASTTYIEDIDNSNNMYML